MRIGSPIPRTGETLGAKETPQQAPAGAGPTGPTPGAADQAAALNREDLLARALASEQHQRTERVEGLALQVSSGSYAIDSVELGRALVKEMFASSAEA